MTLSARAITQVGSFGSRPLRRRTVFATSRRADGPAMSVVYYLPTDTDELLVSTMCGRGKARAVARKPEGQHLRPRQALAAAHLEVYCDATVEDDPSG